MRAVVFNQYGDVDVLQVADISKPTPAQDEVLVRVRASAVNPKDTFIRKGRFKRFTGTDFPQQVGFDFAGEVAQSNVSDYQTGDNVFGMLEGWHGGSCAEYVTVKTNQLAKLPETVPYNQAASVPLVALTSLRALRDEGNIEAGQRVCINGASGGVGSIAVQIAKIYGAHVTAIASSKNHDFLTNLGADVCLDYKTQDITQHDQTFDIFFDVFGNQRFAKIKPILTKNGRWVSTVLQPHVFISMALTYFTSKKAKMVVVKSVANDLELIGQWIADRKLQPVIHATYPLEQIQEAHRQQQTKHTRGKLVIVIE